MTVTLDHPRAQRVAEAIVMKIRDACVAAEVVGELRRGRAQRVDHLLIMAAPRVRRVDDIDELVLEDLLETRIRKLVESKQLNLREGSIRSDSVAYYLETPFGLRVDIVAIRPPVQWGVAMVAMTGPDAHFRGLMKSAEEQGYGFYNPLAPEVNGSRASVHTERRFYELAGRRFVPPADRV